MSSRSAEGARVAGGEALLRLCAAPDDRHDGAFAALEEGDWLPLAHAAVAWRCGPLLARAIASLPPNAAHPALRPVAGYYRLNPLRQKAAAARLAEAARAEGGEALFLKGPALAWGCYPDPALRPMRDIDVLLEPEIAAALQARLAGDPRYGIHPELPGTRRTSPEHHPPLQDARFKVTIEIHHRVGFPDPSAQGDALTRALRHRPRPLALGDAEISVPGAEATLVHLASAAVRKDRLSGAALVLADLHYLAKDGIDWPLTIAIAEEAGARRSLALLAAVAQRFGARWVPGALEDDVADAGPHVPAAIAALLAPPGSLERRHILERVAREAGGGASSLGALRLAFSPDPAQLAAIAGVGAHSPWRWLGWPEWALRRTAAYLRARVDARGAMSSVGADLRAWADGG